MSRKVSLFSIKIFSIFLIASIIVSYLMINGKYLYLLLFLSPVLIIIMSFFNAIYTLSLRNSVFEQMNINKRMIYFPIYIWGTLNYVPLILVTLFYIFNNISRFGFIGILIIINEFFYIVMITRKKYDKIFYYTIVFTCSLIIDVLLYLFAMGRIM